MDTPGTNIERGECSECQIPLLNNSQDNFSVMVEEPSTSSQNLKVNSKASTVGISSIDQHPYARGSVIEILCRTQPKEIIDNNNDDDEDMDEEEESDWKDEKNQPHEEGEIRLADIIDRAPTNTPNHVDAAYRWKYYVHYRDFNRRMDEWVDDPKRIVGPPSVGNAKVCVFFFKVLL